MTSILKWAKVCPPYMGVLHNLTNKLDIKIMIITRFKRFKEKYGKEAFKKLNEFFQNEERIFYKNKIKELLWNPKDYLNIKPLLKHDKAGLLRLAEI
jgi:hypothetical protein